jgi:hypothetical protein
MLFCHAMDDQHVRGVQQTKSKYIHYPFFPAQFFSPLCERLEYVILNAILLDKIAFLHNNSYFF